MGHEFQITGPSHDQVTHGRHGNLEIFIFLFNCPMLETRRNAQGEVYLYLDL